MLKRLRIEEPPKIGPYLETDTRYDPGELDHWGRWIEARLRFLGMNGAAALARAVGMSERQVSRWLASPTPPALHRKSQRHLSRALEITPDMLLWLWRTYPPQPLPPDDPRVMGDPLMDQPVVCLRGPDGRRESLSLREFQDRMHRYLGEMRAWRARHGLPEDHASGRVLEGPEPTPRDDSYAPIARNSERSADRCPTCGRPLPTTAASPRTTPEHSSGSAGDAPSAAGSSDPSSHHPQGVAKT